MSKPLSAGQATLSALVHLQQAATVEDADRAIAVAASQGVDDFTCQALRREWAKFVARKTGAE